MRTLAAAAVGDSTGEHRHATSPQEGTIVRAWGDQRRALADASGYFGDLGIRAGLAADGWFGIAAPRGTPSDIVEKLNTAIGAADADPKVKSRLLALGVEPRAMTPPEFKDFIAADVAKWAKVIKFAGIKPE
jgi:hypothetical protein